MRMAASWFGSVDPPNTSMWRDWSAPPSELPSDRHPDPQQASRRCSEPPSRPNKSSDGPKSQLLRAPARPPPGGPAPGETLDKRSTDRTRKLTMKKSRTSSHKTRLTTKSPYKLGSVFLLPFIFILSAGATGTSVERWHLAQQACSGASWPAIGLAEAGLGVREPPICIETEQRPGPVALPQDRMAPRQHR